ncbi:hypothetical protein N431DRAFT_354179 [Stipitochalara longipes BDJ]|nr:hypothetical protein N431DRAFT_354179 [Stipitochalara longipes BDJ]
MTNSEINIVGILRPKPGKMDRLVELLSAVANRIHAEEKDISRFSVSREVNPKTKEPTNTLVLIETYESQITFDRHFAAPEYAEFQATLRAENIIDFKDPVDAEIRVVKQVTGFM